MTNRNVLSLCLNAGVKHNCSSSRGNWVSGPGSSNGVSFLPNLQCVFGTMKSVELDVRSRGLPGMSMPQWRVVVMVVVAQPNPSVRVQ